MGKSKLSIDDQKYSNAILFFTKYCNNKYLGATKLNKLLYYLDFISYRDRRKSVTGDIYIHEDYGPVPSKSDEILAKLSGEGKVKVERVEYKESGTFKYEAKQDPDMSVFSEYEKKLLGKICKEFLLWSTDKIVNQTHLEAPWFYSKPYDIVDLDYSSDIEFFSPNPS